MYIDHLHHPLMEPILFLGHYINYDQLYAIMKVVVDGDKYWLDWFAM